MEEVENILSCSICMETFRIPRVLPCQHTFCHDCLSDYIRDISLKKGKAKKAHIRFQCPLCRKKVEVKDEPFDSSVFPLNLTVVALLDSSILLRKCCVDNTHKTVNFVELVNEASPEVRDDGDIDNLSFDMFLDGSVRMNWRVIHHILNPIGTYKQGFSLKILLAVLLLLIYVIMYVCVLGVLIQNDLLLIYVLISFLTYKDIVIDIWRLKRHKNIRIILKVTLGQIVIHIFECVMLCLIIFFLFFVIGLEESLRTAPVRRFTVLSDLGHPLCMEEKYLQPKLVFNQAFQIMRMKFQICVTRYHCVREYWFAFARDCFRMILGNTRRGL